MCDTYQKTLHTLKQQEHSIYLVTATAHSPSGSEPLLVACLLQLNIRRCDSVVALASCSSLQSLQLEDCRKVSDLSPLTSLSKLHTLLLRNLRHLVDLQPVAQVRCCAGIVRLAATPCIHLHLTRTSRGLHICQTIKNNIQRSL